MSEGNAKKKRVDRPMRFLPVGIDIKGKKILVFGGGRIALQKLRTILLFNPKVTVVAPKILSEIKDMGVDWVEEIFSRNHLAEAFLVYACTSDPETNRVIASEAGERGILCNVADDTDACAFISPAVAVADDLVISVNSQGRNPNLSRVVRDFIKESVDEFLHGRD